MNATARPPVGRVVLACCAAVLAASACSAGEEPVGLGGRPIVTAVADPADLSPPLSDYAFVIPGDSDLWQFRQISASYVNTCGVLVGGAFACIGQDSHQIVGNLRPVAAVQTEEFT